jgi:hypothetical protein
MATYAGFFALILVGIVAGEGTRRIVKHEIATWGVYAVFAVVIAAYVWQASLPPVYLSDFKKAYYPSGEIIRTDPELLYPDDVALLFVNIPIVAWLFVPFSYLDIDTAGAIMTALGLLAIVVSFVALVALGKLARNEAAMLAGAFVISGPLYYSVREGNTTHFVLLALIGMVWLAGSGKYGWAGLLLGAASIIKPPLALVALPFLIRQRWDFVTTFAATGLVVCGLSLAIYGIDLHRDWYDYAVRPYAERPLGAENVQSIDGVLARLYTDDHLDDFTPIEELGAGFRLIRTALAGALFIATAFVLWRARRDDAPRALWADASIAMILALLIAPTSWTHYYLLLLLPIALILAGGLGVAWSPIRVVLFAAAVAMVSPPVLYVNPNAPLLGWFVTHVFMSHYFFGGLLLLGLLLEARWRISGDLVEQRAGSERELVAA